jgi:hypothetical protein
MTKKSTSSFFRKLKINIQLVNIPGTLVPLMLAALLGGIAPSLATATTININPSKDNTLYEFVPVDGDRSNGVGVYFFAGVTDQAERRRGVLAFDIAGSIPAGSTITSVSLTMNMSRTLLNTARTVELHKLLADWGQGTSNASGQEGQGISATTNDATWRHRFYNAIFWTTPGGDFSGTVSASQSVGAIGLYVWTSAQMVADVQSWLDNAATNFGWLVLGNESTSDTAKRFNTRESTIPPVLTIEYTEPTTITLTARGKKIGGINTSRLTWNGANSANIDVYRDGVVIATTPNDGLYDDSTGTTGRVRFTYKVCEAGTGTCSNDATVRFRQ